MASAPAAAEEISLLAGLTDTGDYTSYAWGLEYRQHLLAHLDASFGYLNEGHIPAHDRDGAVLQLWGNTGDWLDRFTLGIGAGPYAYFDTQSESTGIGFQNHHGVGVIVSGYLSYSLSPRWFAQLQIDDVIAPGDLGSRTVMLGAGYRLDRFIEELALSRQGDQSGAVFAAPNELGMFVGQTVVNDPSSDRTSDFGIEYRFRIAQHVEFSTSLLDEGGPGGRHAGATGELWLVQDFLDGQLATGVGLGPYVAFEKYRVPDGLPGASVVGLASMTLSWRFTRSVALRLNWHRGFTGDDQDRDIITAGLGWRF